MNPGTPVDDDMSHARDAIEALRGITAADKLLEDLAIGPQAPNELADRLLQHAGNLHAFLGFLRRIQKDLEQAIEREARQR